MRAGSDDMPAATHAIADTRHGRVPVVLVLGGAGFIGRHAVAALQRRGCRVVIGTRHPHRRLRETLRRERRGPAHLDIAGAQNIDAPADAANTIAYREAHLERLLDASTWGDLLEGVDHVINCVGILRQRGRETYERVHHRAPAALAAACAERRLRLIHISALGLEGPARSGFLRSKRDGEAALRASDADWRIVRPSLLDGEGGYGARWLRRVAAWPIHPLPRGACGRIATLHVEDLGEALATLALREDSADEDFANDDSASINDAREFDLGGLVDHTLAEYLASLRALRGARPAWRIALPDLPTRLVAHLCDLLHLTPFSFGHWELLQRDNRPQRNALPALLGRAPRAIGIDHAPRVPTSPPLHPALLDLGEG